MARLLTEAFGRALRDEYGLDRPTDALVSLVDHIQPGDAARAAARHQNRPPRAAGRGSTTGSPRWRARRRSGELVRGGRADPCPLPDEEGYVERDGVRVFWEVYGEGEADDTAAARPGRSSTRAMWKTQIPYLARHFRVVTFDPRGNGASDRPADARGATRSAEFAADALDVMDATGTERAVIVGNSRGAQRGLLLARRAPRAGPRRGLHRPVVPGQPAWRPALAADDPPARAAAVRADADRPAAG